MVAGLRGNILIKVLHPAHIAKPDFKLSRVLVTELPLLDVLHLFANLLDEHLKLDGCVGYFAANGEFDTCIALRTAVVKNKKFYVQAGAGIVADSKPKNEYEETVNKAKALINALR